MSRTCQNQSATTGDPEDYGGLNRGAGHVNVIVIEDAPPTKRQPQPSVQLLP